MAYPAIRTRFLDAGYGVNFIADDEAWGGPAFLAGNVTITFTGMKLKLRNEHKYNLKLC